MAIIKFVTHFGDLAVVLPLAMAALLWFAYIRAKHLILYWAISLATCMLITIILKMHFISCPSTFLDLRSPSGHSSVSILVYGGLSTIGAKNLNGARRYAAIAATTLLIVLVALSRWLLGAHTVPEILIGLAIGGFALIPFCYAYQKAPAAQFAPKHLLALLAILPFMLALQNVNTESILSRTAAYLEQIAPTCRGAATASDDSAQ